MSRSSGPGIRVLTLNLWGRRGEWRERRGLLVDELRRLRPDLVAFQEAIWTPGYDQAADLLGGGYHLAHQSAGRADDGEGASLASRWPLGTVREVQLHVTPRTSGYPCAALVAEVLAPPPPGGPLLFVDHKPSWQPSLERERELQAMAVARAVEELVADRRLPVVLAGDLDAAPDAASVRLLCGGGVPGGMHARYEDAWMTIHGAEAGHTFSPRNALVSPEERGRRIDYVLLRRDGATSALIVDSCRLALDEPRHGVWASDHFGVVADLSVAERGGGGAARPPRRPA